MPWKAQDLASQPRSSTDPDPIGNVTLTKDPRLAHERAGSTFLDDLHHSLGRIGLFRSFCMSGKTMYPLGPGREKEPEGSLSYHREKYGAAS